MSKRRPAAFTIWNFMQDARGYALGGKIHYGTVKRAGAVRSGSALCGRAGQPATMWDAGAWPAMRPGSRCERCVTLAADMAKSVTVS